MNLQFLFSDRKLPWWLLIVPILLVGIYSMLSCVAFFNPTNFFTSMSIPIPEHNFMILSWGGKNTAIVVGLLLSILSRRVLPLSIMLVVFVTMQFGDINAGARTNVNVFVTYIGLACVILEVLLLGFYQSKNS